MEGSAIAGDRFRRLQKEFLTDPAIARNVSRPGPSEADNGIKSSSVPQLQLEALLSSPAAQAIGRLAECSRIEELFRTSLDSNEEIKGLLIDENLGRPDEKYVRNCFDRLQEVKNKLENDNPFSFMQLEAAVDEILKEIAHKVMCGETPGSYNSNVVSLLMLQWNRKVNGTTSYDAHMQEHVEALKTNFRAWNSNRHRYHNLRQIRVLDASCGTGQALAAFLDTLPEELLPKLRVVANDISSASLEIAKQTLARFEGNVKIEFTRYDITQELPPGQSDVILLSQTIGLICDDKALMDQRLGISLPSESRHKTAKQNLIKSLLMKLKPSKGELLLVDEDEMKLSGRPANLDEVLEYALFQAIFQSIGKASLHDVIKSIKEAKFRGQVESFIDRSHTMYLISLTRVRNKELETDTRDNPEDANNIIRRLENMHPLIIERLQTFDENGGTLYRKIGPANGQRLIIDLPYYKENIEGKPHYWRKNGSYDLAIISGLVHYLGVEKYRDLIEKLKTSRKIEAGAAILSIDQWPWPKDSPNPVGNSDARLAFNGFDDQVFCASVRSGNKFGYLHVVRNL